VHRPGIYSGNCVAHKEANQAANLLQLSLPHWQVSGHKTIYVKPEASLHYVVMRPPKTRLAGMACSNWTSLELSLLKCRDGPRKVALSVNVRDITKSWWPVGKIGLLRELEATPVVLNVQFHESVWISIPINNNKNDDILVGCIYRSPYNSGEKNNQLLQLPKAAPILTYTPIYLFLETSYITYVYQGRLYRTV